MLTNESVTIVKVENKGCSCNGCLFRTKEGCLLDREKVERYAAWLRCTETIAGETKDYIFVEGR